METLPQEPLLVGSGYPEWRLFRFDSGTGRSPTGGSPTGRKNRHPMEAHVILENINRPLTKQEQYELAGQLADAASEIGLRFSNTTYMERGL